MMITARYVTALVTLASTAMAEGAADPKYFFVL